MPATRCDLDHIQAWADGGTTSLTNLTTLCEAHHRLKHTPGWSLTRTANGTLTWRTPTGARYQREPDGTIIRLPRRVGPHSLHDPGSRAPQAHERALTASVLARLERGLQATNSCSCDAGVHGATGVGHRRDGTDSATPACQPVLTTREPRPGQQAGAYEPTPYHHALHELGLVPLLDEIPPF